MQPVVKPGTAASSGLTPWLCLHRRGEQRAPLGKITCWLNALLLENSSMITMTLLKTARTLVLQVFPTLRDAAVSNEYMLVRDSFKIHGC